MPKKFFVIFSQKKINDQTRTGVFMKEPAVVTSDVMPAQGAHEVVVVKKGYLSNLRKEVLGSAEALSGSENIVLRKLGNLAGGALNSSDYTSPLESKAASRITANFYLNKLRLEMSMPQSEWRIFVRDSPDLQETMLDLFDIRVAESLIRKSTVDLDGHVSLSREEIECFVKSVFFSSAYEKIADRLLGHIFNVSGYDACNVIWGFYNKKLIRGERIIEHIVLRGEAFLGALIQSLSTLEVPNRQSIIDNFRSRVLMGEPLISVIRDLQFTFNVPVSALQQLRDVIIKNPYNAKMLEVGVLLLMEHEKSYRPYDDSVGLATHLSNTVWGVYSKVRRVVIKRSSPRAKSSSKEPPFVSAADAPSTLQITTNGKKGDNMNLANISSGVQKLCSRVTDSITHKKWSGGYGTKKSRIIHKEVEEINSPRSVMLAKNALSVDDAFDGSDDEELLGFDLDALLAPAGYSLAPNTRQSDLKHYFAGLPPLNQLTLSKYHMALQHAKSDGLIVRG